MSTSPVSGRVTSKVPIVANVAYIKLYCTEGRVSGGIDFMSLTSCLYISNVVVTTSDIHFPTAYLQLMFPGEIV